MEKFSRKHVSELEKIVGKGDVTVEQSDLSLYSYDATTMEHLPDCVVFPATTEEVSGVMKLASEWGIPVVPRGAGSGMSGGSIPIDGGIVMSLTSMKKIIQMDRENLICRVESGAVTGVIASAASAEGLYYPPDPSSLNFCTIGGNIAHNSGGLHALKYGVTKNWVIGLTSVLPNGEVLKTGVRTMKGVVGYDLTKLICGSEGTLAIVTEATLKLIPQPKCRAVAAALFPSSVKAGAAVSSIMAARIFPAMLELMDGTAIKCVEQHLHLGFPADAGGMLLVELDGHPEAVKSEVADVVKILESHGAYGIRHATDAAECERLWEARRSVAPSLGKVSPRRLSEDITVPRTEIPHAIELVMEIGKKHGLKMAVFGHAGDGNLHVNILEDQRDEKIRPAIYKAVEEILMTSVNLGGTISGEHGVGLTKKKYIGMEIGPEGLRVLRDIKKVFDPKNILNPSKILPGEDV